jgi:S-DNA-T family DNA segregation ATPase FtsK/SpoIIIE
MATQRPSVNIITGVIKANVPVKLAFTVVSQTDSRVIVGEKGAERLLSKGDALLQVPGKELIRVQAPMVTDDEIERVIKAVQ